ncbi:putative protein YcbX [Anaerolineae bacterium]|nr:putative protein YcbX [Anaerolineae bacterium]
MTLASILIYPIKALDPVRMQSARITAGGILEFDRVWALRGLDGKFICGKSTEAIHKVRARFMLPGNFVTLSWGSETEEFTFRLGDEDDAIAGWLERRLGQPVRFDADPVRGFPDDTEAFGPTVVSEATLDAVASWFPGISRDEMIRRFRPNLIVAGVPAFWEDRLYTATGSISFRIGDVVLSGQNPCARCVVPTREPLSGDALPQFMKTFIERRERTLPPWAAKARFDHYYRLSVNTTIGSDEAGKAVRVGDAVAIM